MRDLEKFDVPTLVIQGEDDQVVPFSVGGQASAAMIDGAVLKAYPGAPHGITDTHRGIRSRRRDHHEHLDGLPFPL
jgi:non-heme chloroperoxidase